MISRNVTQLAASNPITEGRHTWLPAEQGNHHIGLYCYFSRSGGRNVFQQEIDVHLLLTVIHLLSPPSLASTPGWEEPQLSAHVHLHAVRRVSPGQFPLRTTLKLPASETQKIFHIFLMQNSAALCDWNYLVHPDFGCWPLIMSLIGACLDIQLWFILSPLLILTCPPCWHI